MDIIQQMKSLGVTEYEAKAYLSLLENHPINGYALSKNSGVPRSRIYEVLDGLVKKQIVFESQEGKNTVFTPLEPGLLTEKLRLGFEETIGAVDTYAKDLYKGGGEDTDPKQLKGLQDIMAMVKVLMKDAKHRIALSIWDEELQLILPEIEAVQKRGVLVRGMYFGTESPLPSLVGHRRMDRYVAEYKERYFILIIDDRHIISGIMSRGREAQATWSKDPGIIKISDDYIAHDVMINTYSHMLGAEARHQYETTLDDVRRVYYGYSDEDYHQMPLPK